MTQLTYFPSLEDRTRILCLRKELGIAALEHHDRTHLHAYDYGWRRAVLGELTPASPLDPDGRWLDPTMIAAAERMWRIKLNIRSPEPGARRQEPTPDDIAHVEAVCNIVRDAIAVVSRRSARVFAGPQQPPVRQAYDELGSVADECVMVDLPLPGSDLPLPGSDLAAWQKQLGISATPHDDIDVEDQRHRILRNMQRE